MAIELNSISGGRGRDFISVAVFLLVVVSYSMSMLPGVYYKG
jgi:hypothetical protein